MSFKIGEITDCLIYKKIVIPDEANHYIFSDVHGRKKEVDELIKQVGGKKNDYYTFVGDVIDRGEHSLAMLFQVLYGKNTNMTLGNHEYYMMLCSENDDVFTQWTLPNNGGDKTFKQVQYMGMEFFSKQLSEQCPLILEIEHRGKRFGIIHAEVPYFFNKNHIHHWNEIIEEARKNPQYAWELLWSRDTIDQVFRLLSDPTYLMDVPEIEGIDYVIHGHTGVSDIIQYKNMVWCDTGYTRNRISMLEFNNDQNIFNVYRLDEESYHHIYLNNNLEFN